MESEDFSVFQRIHQDFCRVLREDRRALVSQWWLPVFRNEQKGRSSVVLKDVTLKYETFLKVRDFGSAHAQEFPDGSPARAAFDTVARAAAKIEAHATALAEAQAEGRRVKASARAEIAARLASIARTTREASVDTPGVAPAPAPKLKSNVALLSAARAFLKNGQAAMDRLVPLGLPPTLLTELREQVERFEQAAKVHGEAKAVHATERAGIADALADGTRALQRLHVIVTNTFARNPVQLAEWKRVRRVARKPKSSGTSKTSAAPEAVTTTSAAPGQPETAAAPRLVEAPAAVAAGEPLKRAS